MRNPANPLDSTGTPGAADTTAGLSDAHPYRFFEYEAAPYFIVTLRGVDTDGNELFTSKSYAPAGEHYVLVAPYRSGLAVISAEGTEGLERVSAPVTVTLTYGNPSQVALTEVNSASASKPTGIFDLQGRRLPAATAPGLYIIDGHKVIVR